MSAAFSFRYATDTVVAKETFVHVEVTGADVNTADGDAINYYIVASKSGEDNLQSVVFGPNADGDWTWDNLLFPATGTWDVTLYDEADDSVVVADTITVV